MVDFYFLKFDISQTEIRNLNPWQITIPIP